MKTSKFLIILFTASILLGSCEKIKDLFEKDKVEKNGLTKEINELVPDSVLNTIKGLGMPINTGDDPPDIEKIFNAAPFILIASNVVGDSPGGTFADYKIEFFDQNNDDLTVKFNYVSSYETGTGVASLIVGNKDDFTVFAEVTSQAQGTTAYLLNVISGTITEGGISDFYYTNWMLDNQGNSSIWIENNTGRVLYDSDGFSEEVDSLKKAEIDNKNLNPIGSSK